MRKWIKAFLVWWRTSPAGKGAHAIVQNIGTSWSLNALCMALYIGDVAQATEIATQVSIVLACPHVHSAVYCLTHIKWSLESCYSCG